MISERIESIRNLNPQSRNWVQVSLISSSVVIWAISTFLSEPPPIYIENRYFGLFSSFHISYYIAVFLLFISFIFSLFCYNNEDEGIDSQQRFLLYLNTILLISFLYLTPIVLELSPRPGASYKFLGNVNYIIETGKVSPNNMWYHTWPGFFLIDAAFLTQLPTNFSFLFLILYPLLWNIFFFPLFITFLKEFINNDKVAVVGYWFFLVFNWVGQDYLSPQSFAYLLCIFILVLFSRISKNGIKKEYSLIIILTLSIVTILISHITTTAFILLFIGIFGISVATKLRKRILFFFIPIILFILIIFFLANADRWLSRNVLYFIENLIYFRFPSIVLTLNLFFKGSPDHILIAFLRVLITIIFFSITLVCLLDLFFKKEIKFLYQNTMLFAYIMSFFAFSLFLILVYEDETFQRLLLFCLPLCVVVISMKIIKRKEKTTFFLISLLILSFPLTIIARYGNEALDYSSNNSFEAGQYVIDLNLDHSEIVVIGDILMLQMNIPSKFTSVHIGKEGGDWNGTQFIPINQAYLSHSQLVIITSRLKWYYKLLYNSNLVEEIEAEMRSSSYYNHIFSSPDANVFFFSQ